MPNPKAATKLTAFANGRANVALSGEWNLRNGFPAPNTLLREIAAAVAETAAEISPQIAAPNAEITIHFDCAELGRYDSCLPAYLFALLRAAQTLFPKNKFTLAHTTLPETVGRMLALATARPAENNTAATAQHPPHAQLSAPAKRPSRFAENFFHNVGATVTNSTRALSLALAFVGETMTAFLNLARGRARCRFREFWFFVQACGVNAFPIIGLISFLTGLILAYVGALQMRQVGAMIYVPGGVAISMMREMGVLMVAVVLCGRTATAYAAQLGSMKVSEEMSAYRSMGVSPIEYLVLPRILALMVMTPFLTLYANFFGIIGGLFVTAPMGVSIEQSYNMTAQTMTLPNFTSGPIKSIVFAILIGWVGCYRGIICGKSSEAVGDAATSAAVLGITFVIIADAIFAVLFNILDFF